MPCVAFWVFYFFIQFMLLCSMWAHNTLPSCRWTLGFSQDIIIYVFWDTLCNYFSSMCLKVELLGYGQLMFNFSNEWFFSSRYTLTFPLAIWVILLTEILFKTWLCCIFLTFASWINLNISLRSWLSLSDY